MIANWKYNPTIKKKEKEYYVNKQTHGAKTVMMDDNDSLYGYIDPDLGERKIIANNKYNLDGIKFETDEKGNIKSSYDKKTGTYSSYKNTYLNVDGVEFKKSDVMSINKDKGVTQYHSELSKTDE